MFEMNDKELFQYAWYGMRGGYYDTADDKINDIPCFGSDCTTTRIQLDIFPLLEVGLFNGKRICGKKQVT